MSKDGESAPNDVKVPAVTELDSATDTLISKDATPIVPPTMSEESAAFAEVAAKTARESQAAAERLAVAQAKLEEIKSKLDDAPDMLTVETPHATTAPLPDDVDTEIDRSPPPVARSRPDPLNAAEQALAMAAKARGVPLELPSRVPPDRSDPFAAATRALQTARIARGDVPKTQASSTPAKATGRDPFKAAEEALERAAAVRADVGVSPEQEQREANARMELARLRRVGSPAASHTDDDDTPVRKKRDL